MVTIQWVKSGSGTHPKYQCYHKAHTCSSSQSTCPPFSAGGWHAFWWSRNDLKKAQLSCQPPSASCTGLSMQNFKWLLFRISEGQRCPLLAFRFRFLLSQQSLLQSLEYIVGGETALDLAYFSDVVHSMVIEDIGWRCFSNNTHINHFVIKQWGKTFELWKHNSALF